MTNKFGKTVKLLFIVLILILITYFVHKYGIENIRAEVQNFGIWAPLALFLLRSISIIIPALPSTAYSILSGTLLGFRNGLLLICLADLTSCSISFYLSRNYGRSLVRDIIGKDFITRVEDLSKKHFENNFFLMVGFLMTGLFDFVSYAIGLTKAPWKKFAPALIISILLSNPPIVALGAGLLDGSKKFIFIGLFGVFLLALVSSRLQTSLKIDNTKTYK